MNASPLRLAVSRAKLLDYLLNPAHAVGGPKAAFFVSHGFSPADPFALARALVDHAMASAPQRSHTPYGLKLVFEEDLDTPSGQRPIIRSVWIEAHPGGAANLVTAYPLRGAWSGRR